VIWRVIDTEIGKEPEKQKRRNINEKGYLNYPCIGYDSGCTYRMRQQQHSARCDFCPGGKLRGSICRAR
jgi:hypothetical protein